MFHFFCILAEFLINQKTGSLGNGTAPEKKKCCHCFVVYFLFFPILNKPAAYLTALCFERVQWWEQWDGGSRGSLLKEQFWLSWENEYADDWRHAVQRSTVQALCKAFTKCSRLCWESGVCPWTQQGSLLCNIYYIIFTKGYFAKWPQPWAYLRKHIQFS